MAAGFRELARDLVPETRLICLCDCEADIYELLATAAEQAPDQPHVEYVIRSQFDRTLVDDGSLRASIQRQPVLGEVDGQGAATPTRVWFNKRCGLKAPAGKESWAAWGQPSSSRKAGRVRRPWSGCC